MIKCKIFYINTEQFKVSRVYSSKMKISIFLYLRFLKNYSIRNLLFSVVLYWAQLLLPEIVVARNVCKP